MPGRARRAARRRAVLLVPAVTLVVVAATTVVILVRGPGLPRPVDCQATVEGRTVTLTPEQMGNAAIIAGIAVRRGLPARAATIGIATAMQESTLVNVDYGDRDSLGLFQQRPSQGWGTKKQVQDPVYATNAFYDVLVKVEGYRSLPITKAAQKVQRSAYPDAHAQHEAQARVLASALTGQSPAAVSCRLPKVSATAGATELQVLTAAVGHEQARAGRTTIGGASGLRFSTGGAAQAWSLAQWSVARADALGIAQVYAGGRVWERDTDTPGWAAATAATAPPAGSDDVVVLLRADSPA